MIVSATGTWLDDNHFALKLPPGTVITRAWIENPSHGEVPVPFEGHTLTIDRNPSCVLPFHVLTNGYHYSGGLPQ